MASLFGPEFSPHAQKLRQSNASPIFKLYKSLFYAKKYDGSDINVHMPKITSFLHITICYIHHLMVDFTLFFFQLNWAGFAVSSKGCCGTGQFEFGNLCKGQRTCAEPNQYIFWDAVHPTEKMYRLIADEVLSSVVNEVVG